MPQAHLCPPHRTRELRDLLPAGERGCLHVQRRPHHQEVGCADRAVPAGVPRTHVHCEQVSMAGPGLTGGEDSASHLTWLGPRGQRCSPEAAALEEQSFCGEAACGHAGWSPGAQSNGKLRTEVSPGVTCAHYPGLQVGVWEVEVGNTLTWLHTAPCWAQGKASGGHNS